MEVSRTKIFLSELKKKKNEKDIKRICEKELEYLREKTSSLASLRTYVTNYRNAIRSWDCESDALRFLKCTKSEIDEVNRRTQANTAKEHRSQRKLNADEFIIKCNELIKSTSYLKLTVGLAGLTGRRTFELLVSGYFEEVEDDNFLLFSGQAKTKKGERAKTYPYQIPILGDSSFVLERFDFLRSVKKLSIDDFEGNDDSGARYRKFNRMVSSSLGRIMKKGFEGIIENPKPKDLRAAYAEIACDFFNGRVSDRVTKAAFFADVLGHSENDIQTAQSYEDFYLI